MVLCIVAHIVAQDFMETIRRIRRISSTMMTMDERVAHRLRWVRDKWSRRMRENNTVTRTFLWLMFFTAVCAGWACGNEIAISQSLDRFSIPFEDSVRFDIVLQWQGSQSSYLFTSPLGSSFDRLKVRGFTSSISSTGSGDDEVTTKRFRYTLVPTSAGAATIDPITVSYISWPDSVPGQLLTEAMTVQIAEPLPPVEEDSTVVWWIVIVGSVVVLGLVASVLVKRSAVRHPKEIEKTPVEEFLGRLTALKREAGGDLKKFQVGLYESMAAFLKARFDIESDQLGDDELVSALETTNLNEDQRKHIGQWLVQARQDKFRPVIGAPGETVRLETEIRQFFEKL
jgi:hypothetical protein